MDPIKIESMRGGNMPGQPWEIRCDRDSVLGNPYNLSQTMTREDSCDKYETRFNIVINPPSEASELAQYKLTPELCHRILAEIDRLVALYQKHGKLSLYCWCEPQQCHTETIKSWIEHVCAYLQYAEDSLDARHEHIEGQL